MSKQISEFNWEKRLLLVSYQNENDLIFNQSTKFISNFKCEINERNLKIIFFENFKNKEYATPIFILDKIRCYKIFIYKFLKKYYLQISILNFTSVI